jgi:CAAX protease family protein
MQIDPEPTPGLEPVPAPPLPATEEKKLLAPVWHTVLMVAVMLANSAVSFLMSRRMTSTRAGAITDKARIIEYVGTIALELFLLLLLWLGLRLRQTRIRDVIGGRWATVEDFLLDFVMAFGFWIVAYGILIGLSFALGLAKPAQLDEAKKLAQLLAPHSGGALAVFILLSITAGFVEELIFRGYLQRQLGALSGNIYVGLIASAVIFGGGHGYEGTRRMLLIFIYGMMFGLLALWRKSLRPGMMAHAWHDALMGVVLYFVATKGLIPMR